jgi:outer membrane protein assembly factor BamB
MMAVIEIRHRTGQIETRELSKAAPLLVGHLPTTDIQVDADGVAPIHCRISWKRKEFEVTSVSPDGVQFNGRMVRQSVLAPGDVIRVGDVDIVLLSESLAHEYPVAQPAPPADAPPATFGLPNDSIHMRALTEESLPVRSFHMSSQLAEEARAGKQREGADEPAGGPAVGEPPDASNGEDRHDLSRAAQVALGLDELAQDERRAEPLDLPDDRHLSPAARVKAALATRRLRPGERDAARSPLVIGLLVGALALVLSAATLWFILAREKAQKQYDLAQSQLAGGQYPLAIESFELFLREHPRHALADQARASIGTAHVEQAIGGGSPAWDKGLEALQKYIDENRAGKQFQENDSPIRKFVLHTADKIAFGAVDTARQLYRRELLPVSAEAVKLIELYSPSDNRPEERLKELAGAVQAAQAAILQREAFDNAVRKIDEALAASRSADALREYRRIRERYGAAAADYRPLSDRLKKACELERSLTIRDEVPREPAVDGETEATAGGRLTLARRIRARTDVASVGVTVFALSDDALYGVDSVTGEPQWRRVLGLDVPFAPIPVSVGQPALLIGDGRRRELLLVTQRTGSVVWRLPLAARPAGAPRVHEGQVYLSRDDGVLEQIDLQTGRSTARLTFTQKIGGPCAVSLSGDRLYLPGHENVIYVLTRRPLACALVAWLGHGPGAIEAPPVMMRSLLLLADNDQQSKSLLRIFETASEDQPPVEIPASRRIEGQVRDLPALRGKDLFVPSSGERISAFRVSETGDDRSLAIVASVQVKSAAESPIYLSTGPDGQMWMLSSALRRFELTQDSLLPSKQELAVGLASQPLQSAGDSLYLGRRLAYSRGVLFAEADRQQMILQWQVALGAAVLECTAPSVQDGTVTCVTSLGDLHQVTPQKLSRGGFDTQSLGQLPVPEGLASALSATRLSDGRLAVWCAGDEPRLWLPGSDGMSREQKLPGPLQAAPVRLGGGLLLALPGRLRLSGRAAGDRAVEDLPAPIGHDEPPRWVSLTALDESQAVVLSELGRVARVQFGTAPVPHLEEITHWDAGSPVDLALALDAGRLFLIDSTSRLVVLAASSLEPLAQVVLDASPAARPRPAGNLVLVELKTGRLVAFDVEAKLAKKWEVALNGAVLTGDPLVAGEELVIALSDGRVFWLDAAGGAISRTVELGQPLTFGPQLWGESVVVGSLDGTLIVVKGRVDEIKTEK